MASSDSALVAAHAIQTLYMRQSALIFDLPNDVSVRSGSITTQTGSFRQRMQFRDFCAHIIKQSRDRFDSTRSTPQDTNRRIHDHNP
jgi:hypothetical protein